MSKLKLNKEPIEVKFGKTVPTSVRTEGYNVITISPSNQYSTSAQVAYGADTKPVNIPQGTKVLFPLIKDFENSLVEVTNQNDQDNTSLMAGWYGLSSAPDVKISNKNKKVVQYKSIGGQTSSGNQTLKITVTSTDATLALIIIGDNKPIPVFFNVKKTELPPQWEEIDNAVFPGSSTYSDSRKFFGQTIFIVNLSLTEDATFQARLI